MILLDTNIVSEPMRPKASTAVIDWLDRQAPETLFLASTSLAELALGIALLPDGRRRQGLDEALRELLGTLFGPRILPFDRTAAEIYAAVIGKARRAGHAISFADGQIASIAVAHGFAVATRDMEPFRAAGVTVIAPWTA